MKLLEQIVSLFNHWLNQFFLNFLRILLFRTSNKEDKIRRFCGTRRQGLIYGISNLLKILFRSKSWEEKTSGFDQKKKKLKRSSKIFMKENRFSIVKMPFRHSISTTRRISSRNRSFSVIFKLAFLFLTEKQNIQKPSFEEPLPVSKNATYILDDIPSEFKEDDVNFF